MTAEQPYNVIGAVLGGLDSWANPGPVMPAFGSKLSDQEIADITNYVRTAWGNKGSADATSAQVFKLRSVGDLPPIAARQQMRWAAPKSPLRAGRPMWPTPAMAS